MSDELKFFEFPCGCKFPILGEEKESDGLPKTKIDFYNINWDCPITWDLLKSGETLGVFQLESHTGQKWALKSKPENVEEVADLSALIRPGVSNSMLDGDSMSEHYVKRKMNLEENISKYPALSKILESTYNVLLYQEQIIAIAKEICGFNLVEADNLRKAVGSKDAEKLKLVGESFVQKASEYGIVSQKEAEEIFSWIYESSRYSFNKCLSPDTEVVTKDGTKKLSELTIGEYVDSPTGFTQVKNIYFNGKKELYTFNTDNKLSITCTLSHKFQCVDGKMKTAGMILSSKDSVITKDGPATFESMKFVKTLPTMDIEVDNKDHVFYGNGIATSNSHAIAYSYVSYYTAYAKAHFPERFAQSYMSHACDGALKKKREVIKDIIQDSKKNGIYVNPPSLLNLFKCNGKDCLIDGKLYYGLANVKGIGESALEKLKNVISEFKPVHEISWSDILYFLSSKINKTTIESLIKCGALSHIIESRKRALFYFSKFNSLPNSIKKWCMDNYLSEETFTQILERMLSMEFPKNAKTWKKASEVLDSLMNPPYNLEEDQIFNMTQEKELLGVSISVNVNDVVDTSICNTNCESAKIQPFQNMIIPCTIQSARFFKIKSGSNIGKEMCSLTFSDDFGTVDAVIWSNVLEECENLIFEGNVVIVFCDPSNRKGQVKVNKLCQA